MPKPHLVFAKAAAHAPPPPLFGSVDAMPTGAVLKKKKKKKAMQTITVAEDILAGKGSQREEARAPARATSAGSLTPAPAPAPAPAPSHGGGKRKEPGAALLSSPRSVAGPPAATLSGAEVGMSVEHVLLVSGLPSSVTQRSLELHFCTCAPLQLTLLHDWTSGRSRGSACLAVAASRAALLASSPAMATMDGARIRVSGVQTSAKAEGGFGGTTSPEMRTAVEAAMSKASAAAGSLRDGDLARLRHLLLSCEAAAAKAAIDEFCAVARSGKPKNPAALLEQTLMRQRHTAGGHVWLGRVNGLPLPEAPTARLRALLDSLDWSAMPADGKLRGTMADNSFKLGLSTKAWAKHNGPYTPFAFKEGMGVWDAASVTKKHRDLWEAAADLIRAADPSYAWTSVLFNRNFRGARHRDDKDASYQVATAFGDYEGGELRVYGQDGVTDVNTRHRFVRFDGRFEHEVLPYSGTRYSVIFFMLAPPWAVDPSSTEEGRNAPPP